MPLDPQAQTILEQMAAFQVPALHTMSPVTLRTFMNASANTSPIESVAHVENRQIPGLAGEIPVRIYTPEGTGPFPTLVFFHGGGWVIGNLDTHDAICRRLTNLASCLVVSVDYRLAPEHPFPAALEDSYAATQWVASNADQLQGDASRIAVGGDSAGGNLSAVVSLLARDRGTPALVFQLLIYPATDTRLILPSIEENAEGYLLTKKDILWFRSQYLPDEVEYTNPLVAPLLAPDLSGLPPALIITAEYDPLRDEGEAYGKRLLEAGVPTTISRYDGAIHGFVDLIELGDQALIEASVALKRAFKSNKTSNL